MGRLYKAFDYVGAYPLSGGVGIVFFGMYALELFKLLHEHIEVAVGYFRLVLHIVVVVVAVKFLPELVYAVDTHSVLVLFFR